MFTNTYESCFNNLCIINALLQVGIYASDLHVWRLHPYHEVSIMQFSITETLVQILNTFTVHLDSVLNSVLKVFRCLCVYHPFLEHFGKYFKIF